MGRGAVHTKLMIVTTGLVLPTHIATKAFLSPSILIMHIVREYMVYTWRFGAHMHI
jgi:hypothetical protein